MTKNSGFSNSSRSSGDPTVARVISAAQTHAWGVEAGPAGGIMATRESGRVGEPWVVLAHKGGWRLRV